MIKNKITQDFIAKELNISRNTVSKVLNNMPGVPEKTRHLVLNKAFELGYKHINPQMFESTLPQEPSDSTRTLDIAFICYKDIFTGSYFTSILSGIEKSVSAQNASLRFIMITNSDHIHNIIPDSLISSSPDAIITAGVFNKEYYSSLASLGSPLISLDIAPELTAENMICDIIMVDNFHGVYELTKHLISQGHKNISFVGEIESCQSFYERWLGYRACMEDHHVVVKPELSFTGPSPYSYYNCTEIINRMEHFTEIPSAFVCANDDIAKTFVALKQKPHEFLSSTTAVTGFDNISEYSYFLSECSTVEIFTEDIGMTIGEEVLWRILHPNRQYRTITLNVKPIIK